MKIALEALLFCCVAAHGTVKAGRFLEENAADAANDAVQYSGSIQHMACLSYTILLEGDNDENEDIYLNDNTILYVGQESFVFFKYSTDGSSDMVDAKTWLSAMTGIDSTCQPFTSDQLDSIFTPQVIDNVIVPSALEESLYYGPVCDDVGSFQMAVFSDNTCNVYIPGLSYLLNHKLSFGVGVEGKLQEYSQNMGAVNKNLGSAIDCGSDDESCSTILASAVNLDTCNMVSEEANDENAAAADADYNGKYDADGVYRMSIVDLQDPTDMCYGMKLMKGNGETLPHWEAANTESIETELRDVYHVSAVEVFWKQHQYAILAGAGMFLSFAAILTLMIVTCRIKRRARQASGEKKRALLEKSGSTRTKKALPKRSSRRDNYVVSIPSSQSKNTNSETSVSV